MTSEHTGESHDLRQPTGYQGGHAVTAKSQAAAHASADCDHIFERCS